MALRRKSLLVIGPAIKKLARNFVIPLALEVPQSLHKNFGNNTNESNLP